MFDCQVQGLQEFLHFSALSGFAEIIILAGVR
jgi:hypothetical protein